MSDGKERVGLVSCMRNEAFFLLEWVAYHLAVGFDRIFIVTNDCTDGTDRLAERLERLGHITHVDNPRDGEVPPQISGMKRVLARPDVQALDWLLHIDADEFLNVAAGAGRVADLLAIAGDADAMALLWRPFGDSGLERWEGGRVLETFLRAQIRPRPPNAQHKTLFRPSRFRAAIDHMPKDPVSPDVRLVNSSGAACSNASLRHPTRSRYRLEKDQLTWENAYINHYAIKSLDIFLMKNHRGDGMARAVNKYFVNSNFWNRQNKNAGEDRSILRHKPEVDARLAEFMADPVLTGLHERALEAFYKARDDVLTPAQIAAWTIEREG
ncbi:MAG: glycosyltransferase family 2 protein [Paracoccaceae bacterium]|nr:glycosyltransferase family 2 protein [Paracoccaceae bacterium]